jgi:hypothetical protein
VIGLALALILGGEGAASLRKPLLTHEQAAAVVRRLSETEPFLSSSQALETSTLGNFFRQQEYRLLRGNPVLGYWYARNFQWKGDRIAWSGIRAVGRSPRSLGVRAWDVAFRQVAARKAVTIDPQAEVRLSGACVAAVIDPTPEAPVPGVLLELRLESSLGVLLYRLAVGKPSVEEAMGAVLDFILEFARAENAVSQGSKDGSAR